MRLKGWCTTAQKILDCIYDCGDAEIHAAWNNDHHKSGGILGGCVWNTSSGQSVMFVPAIMLVGLIRKGYIKEISRVPGKSYRNRYDERKWNIVFRLIDDKDDPKVQTLLNEEKNIMAAYYDHLIQERPYRSATLATPSRYLTRLVDQITQTQSFIIQTLAGNKRLEGSES